MVGSKQSYRLVALASPTAALSREPIAASAARLDIALPDHPGALATVRRSGAWGVRSTKIFRSVSERLVDGMVELSLSYGVF